MRDEPDIVQQLRRAEDMGWLWNQTQHPVNKLEETTQPSENTPKEITRLFSDNDSHEKKENAVVSTEKNDGLQVTADIYKTAFSISPESIIIINKKGIIVAINPSVTTLFGYHPEDLVGKHFSKTGFIKKRNLAFYLKLFRAIIGGKQLEPFEMEVTRRDGTVAIVNVYHSLIRKNGKVAGFIAVGRDITRKKKIEEKIGQSEKKYQALFETTADGILIADIVTRKFKDANPAICKMLDYKQEELLRMSVSDIHPNDSLDCVFSEFEAQAGGEKTLAKAIPCLKKDGGIFYADVNTTTLLIDGVTYNVGFFRDITESKNIEQNLKEKLGELEQYKRVTVGRELKMTELKNRIKEFEDKLREYEYIDIPKKMV